MVKRIPLAWTTVFCNSTAVRILPATLWLPAGQIVGARATFEIAERTGDNETGVGVDFANLENAPDGNPITLFARQTSAAVFYSTDFTSLATQCNSKRLMRFVWLCANTTTSNLTNARVAGYLDLQMRT